MKKKTYYTISAIIAAIAAIFFGVPALSYKEKRKVINGVPNGVFYQPTTTESFIQYTIRYWKELFTVKLRTTNNTNTQEETQLTLETIKAEQGLLTNDPNRLLTSYQEIKKILDNKIASYQGNAYDEYGYSNIAIGRMKYDDYEHKTTSFYICIDKNYKVSESTYDKILEEFKIPNFFYD